MTRGIQHIFTRALEKSQNWDFYVILSSKVKNAWSWNLQRSYKSWQWRMMQNLKRNWLVVSKLKWGISRVLTRALKSLKIGTLMGSFWTKHITFELKKYRAFMFDSSEDWCKIWRKIDLRLPKWHEEFGIHRSIWKISKLRLWWDPFIQSRKCMTLKFTEELRLMKMKNDAKLEEELTCRFRIGMMNLTSFDPSTQKSQKFSL